MHIIIPSSDPNLTLTCLQSIDERDPSFLSKVIVVSDRAGEFHGVTASFPGVTVLNVDEPFNFARWMNIGMSAVLPHAGSVMLLNDDTRLLTDNGLGNLERMVEKPGGVGILSAAIRGTGGVIEQRQVTPGSIRLVDGHIAFTAVAISSAVLSQLGLLDERFVGYGYEDNDYCHRASEAGLPVGVYDGCVIDHYKPHSTFGRSSDFKDKWLWNETLFWEKWRKPQQAAVVVGGSRSGAAVYAAVLDEMGYDMPDKPLPFEKNVSAYYRDDRLSRVARQGDMGARGYVAARDMSGKAWGTRIWPSPESAIRFLSSFATDNQPCLLFVSRGSEARVRSYQQVHGIKYGDAAKRIGQEIEDQQSILEWAREHYPPEKIKVVSFEELLSDPAAAVAGIARFVGHEQSVATAVSRVRPEYVVYRDDGSVRQHPAVRDFGSIAVGVRLTHPEASFVGCYARLIRYGLREGDEILEPAIRTPSHWAASMLMRRFLSSGCDTLLLLDDDMTFPPHLLDEMRDKPENMDFDIVSALATQRIPPPRALVLRVGEQPALPDALNGLYYNLLVDEVVDGQTLPADGTGFAFTLIRREVIEKMTDPEWGPGFTSYVQWGSGGEGEDVNFCRRAGSLGFRTAVDAAAHVGHVGPVVYGYDEFDQWRNARTPTGLSLDKLVELLESALPNLEGDTLATATALLKKARE